MGQNNLLNEKNEYEKNKMNSSNYKEINVENREKAAKEEINKWKNDAERFESYRKEWNKAANDNHLPDHPLHVDIELSDACNLRCKMCVHGLGTMKNVGFMDIGLAKKVIDQCVEIGVCSIKFNWRGEATLNKHIIEAIQYAKSQGILEVQINTNGFPPSEGALIECAKEGIDRIIFSIDGFSKETYEGTRIGGNYEKLLKNIHSLLDWKKELQRTKPFIRIQMVRTKENAHEIPKFIQYWQLLVDDVRISDVTDRGQGNSLSVGDQIAVGRRRCPQPFQRLTIGRDGRVSPCCSDWDQQYIVGNVNIENLSNIWNGQKMNNIRAVQNELKHDTVKICKDCYVKESYVWEKNENNGGD